MKRRGFFKGAMLALAASILGGAAWAADSVAYTPGLIKEELAAGKTVFVDYFAPWCGTCAAQSRAIDALRAENPSYDEKITFIKVDWDTYNSHEVTTSRNVPRRSTLLMLKGDAELGRIIAGTDKAEIKALLDTGL